MGTSKTNPFFCCRERCSLDRGSILWPSKVVDSNICPPFGDVHWTEMSVELGDTVLVFIPSFLVRSTEICCLEYRN